MLTLRRSNDRGLAELGWLKSRHSFSFGHYYDEKHSGFSVLLVINEDRILGGTGFPTHGHQNMEIISYVLSGALLHKDSMGTEAVILPGEVQRMSAGTGVKHSEYNKLKDKETHFFQIWILPEAEGLKPGYAQKDFSKQLAKGDLFLVVSHDGREGSLTMNQDANLYLAKPKAGTSLKLPLAKGRKSWLQLAEGGLKVGNQKLSAGDGLAIENEKQLDVVVEKDAHFLFFDLPE
jgi:redox-sensitive bicupin YhaK (pirin superfamily)